MAGTVVNDNGIVLDAFRRALAATGVEGRELSVALDYAHETMGSPKSVVFDYLLHDEVKVGTAMSEFAAAMDEALGKGAVSEIPGAREALARLRDNGLVVCLTTGFSADVQNAIIEQLKLGEVSDFALAPERGLRGRPYPDMVLAAALRVPVDDVREVVVVGDTANDLWSGHRAGAAIVAGVLTGSHGRAELEQAPHTHILESVAELPPVVLGD